MTFEEIFKTPKNHTLRQVNFRQKGTLAQNEYWKHEELNEKNSIIWLFRKNCGLILALEVSPWYEIELFQAFHSV